MILHSRKPTTASGEPRRCGVPCAIRMLSVHLPASALNPCLLRCAPHSSVGAAARYASARTPYTSAAKTARFIAKVRGPCTNSAGRSGGCSATGASEHGCARSSRTPCTKTHRTQSGQQCGAGRAGRRSQNPLHQNGRQARLPPLRRRRHAVCVSGNRTPCTNWLAARNGRPDAAATAAPLQREPRPTGAATVSPGVHMRQR